ncbi:MAG: putative toxin-antitoxin system toxin component, PIN family [Rhodospirillaceae bacterium]|nr:putative toxin-antitoxin system toxin component, PIN family [Rhodospirillaceae bacterium]
MLDTNVLVSALIFDRGRLAWLRDAWTARLVIPLVSRTTAQEFLDVTAYPKFRLPPALREALVALYLPFCESITRTDVPVDPAWCEDPDDLPFLELALAGRADSIVTGDRALLAAARHVAVPIITPTALRARLRDRTGIA